MAISEENRRELERLGLLPRSEDVAPREARLDYSVRCVCGSTLLRSRINEALVSNSLVSCDGCKSQLDPEVMLAYRIGGQCGICQQKIRKLNPHSMDAHKVVTLSHFARLAEAGWTWIRPHTISNTGHGVLSPRNCALEYSSIANVREHAQRLHWFGLLKLRRSRNAGGYAINAKGKAFLAGEHKVPKTIFCISGIVVDRTPDEVCVDDVRSIYRDAEYWDTYGQLQVSPWSSPVMEASRG